ncbi:MAG: hypothetical protein DRN35_00810 [Thermoplasmata archaeon]|nr:MAG: hypothetical protein DRN28_03250 [Thermoplasmata archaeon]RLF72317.1 MAG: hypothetical protein DRN35_00810 [Thermoplasmata archaeon]
MKNYGGPQCRGGRNVKDVDLQYYLLGFLIIFFGALYLGGVNNDVALSAIVLIYFFSVGVILVGLGVFIERPIEKLLVFLGLLSLALSILLSGALGYINPSYVVGGLIAVGGAFVISYGHYIKKTYPEEGREKK